jgi:hypothetical protein
LTITDVLHDWPAYEVNQAGPSNITASRVIDEVPIEAEAITEEVNPANIALGAVGAEDDVLDEVGVPGDALKNANEEAPVAINLESAVAGSEESVNSHAVAEGEVQDDQKPKIDADEVDVIILE